MKNQRQFHGANLSELTLRICRAYKAYLLDTLGDPNNVLDRDEQSEYMRLLNALLTVIALKDIKTETELKVVKHALKWYASCG